MKTTDKTNKGRLPRIVSDTATPPLATPRDYGKMTIEDMVRFARSMNMELKLEFKRVDPKSDEGTEERCR